MFYRETHFETENGGIPQGWALTTSGQIVVYIKGKNPKGTREEPTKDYAPYLSTGYLRNEENPKHAKISDDSVFVNNGDIILLWDGSNAGEVFLGKAGILSSTMTKLIAKAETVDTRFLFYLLKSKEGYLQALTRGTGIPHVDKTVFKNLILVLPPISEQTEISEVLSTVDEAIQKTSEVIAKTERLKKGLMQELLTKGIGHKEFKETKIGRIPKEWATVELGELLDDIRYGTSVRAEADQEGVLILGIPNVLGGEIEEVNLRYAVMTETETRELTLKDGDILLVRTNANPDYIGRCALFSQRQEVLAFASYLIRIRPKRDSVLPTYLVKYLQSDVARRIFLSIARTSAGNYNINTKGIQSILVPVPSITEQEEIAKVLAELDNNLHIDRKERIRLDSIKRGLMDLLLTGKVRVKVN